MEHAGNYLNTNMTTAKVMQMAKDRQKKILKRLLMMFSIRGFLKTTGDSQVGTTNILIGG